MKARLALPYLLLCLASVSGAQPVTTLMKNVACSKKLGVVARAQVPYSATIVTNDAGSQEATFLEGMISDQGGGNKSGDLTELVKSRVDCLQHAPAGGIAGGSCALTQPFSMRQQEVAHLTVSSSGLLSITWPGGGITTHQPDCLPNGTFVFQHDKYTGVLTLLAAPGPH